MKTKTQYLIGTSGWNYDDWRDVFYPDDYPKRRWFEYYAEHFSVVEVNATFYRFFKDETFKKWYAQAPSGFQYVLKAPQLMTHRRYLKNIEDLAKSFSHSARLLKEKLGLILLQLAPNMPYDLERLTTAIRAFDQPKKLAIEFRHERWQNSEVEALLRKLGVIYCSVDSPQQKLTTRLTSSVGYIRLHGRTQWYDYRYSLLQLKRIAEVAKSMSAAGAKKVYIFFNNDVMGHAPKNALSLKKLLS